MANATLVPWIGATGANAALKRGVFADALRLFAKNGGKLEDLIELLSDLPDGVSQIGNASKLAAGIADQLRAAIATNPLIQSRGPSLDARLLFEGSNQTRISIISFIGLPSDEARQSFAVDEPQSARARLQTARVRTLRAASSAANLGPDRHRADQRHVAGIG